MSSMPLAAVGDVHGQSLLMCVGGGCEPSVARRSLGRPLAAVRSVVQLARVDDGRHALIVGHSGGHHIGSDYAVSGRHDYVGAPASGRSTARHGAAPRRSVGRVVRVMEGRRAHAATR